jgi:hypothetical protein
MSAAAFEWIDDLTPSSLLRGLGSRHLQIDNDQDVAEKDNVMLAERINF